MKVLVYGQWPGQSENILPFFTASFPEADKVYVDKNFKTPFKFIYTGNLVQGKGICEAIDLVTELNHRGENCILEIYGDGPLEKELRNYISVNNLETFIALKERKSLEELKQAYKKAHFVILLSKSEGWPKAIAEGMWLGCIPVATDVSCVPWMLGDGWRGIVVPGSGFQVSGSRFDVQGSALNVQDEWIDKLAGKVQALMEDHEEMRRMSFAAQEWSQEYTLEGFEGAVRELLVKNFNSRSSRT